MGSSDKYVQGFVTRPTIPGVDFQVFLTRFGVAIRRRRVAKKLTQKKLARKVGVEQPSIQRVETGKQGWKSKTVFGIAAALDCSLADLFIEVEQVMPKQLPPEAVSVARIWMLLPRDMGEDYRRRMEGLVQAMSHPVQDELRGREARRIEKPRQSVRKRTALK